MKKIISIVLVLTILSAFAVSAFAAYPVLRKGSTGGDVGKLQTMLNAVMDKDIAVDNIFGNATYSLVKRYQRSQGLNVDGIVGNKTWACLTEDYAAATEKSTLRIGSGRQNPGVIDEGDSYSISGKITSNYKITRVTVSIIPRGEDEAVIEKSAKPNSTSYNISNLGKYIKFGSLDAGTYVFSVTAVDASGTKRVLVTNTFEVKGTEAYNSLFGQTKSKVVSYSLRSDGNTYLTDNFKVKEFKCNDGGATILIDQKLAVLLQDIRNHFGKAVIISSAYRSAEYNKKIGGASQSYHTKGMAADIYIKGVKPIEIARYAESLGVKGIGLYGDFVHIDTRTTKFYWKTSNQISVKTFY